MCTFVFHIALRKYIETGHSYQLKVIMQRLQELLKVILAIHQILTYQEFLPFSDDFFEDLHVLECLLDRIIDLVLLILHAFE
jgi:hypothetical protein